MKDLIRITVVLTLLFGALTANAQNTDRPWYVELGYNVVDFYPNGEGARSKYDITPFGDALFEGYFNTDHYNLSAKSLRLAVGKKIGKNISLELSGAFNEIYHWGSIPISSLDERDLNNQYLYPSYAVLYGDRDKLEYYGIGLSFQYSFRNMINPYGWADPFVGVGGGITMVEVWNWRYPEKHHNGIDEREDEWTINDFIGTGNINFRAGLGIWLSPHFSLVLQTSYKYVPYEHTYKNFTDSHFQHSVGIRYTFNSGSGRNRNCYF